MPDNYDLVVIGAGMAGVTAARKCATSGWQVAIVDELPYGGTCALRGCDPKKLLRRGAEIIEGARLLDGRGIDLAGLAIDWPGLQRHVHGFTDDVPGNMKHGLAGRGVDTLHGTVTFTGPDRIDIDGQTVHAERFLIATGARPRPLTLQGSEHLIDSAEFLYLDNLPPRVLFVGGGFISFEFAHIAARAGTHAVIIDHSDRPLASFDPDLVDLLVGRSRQAGIDVRTSTHVVSITDHHDGYHVTVEHDSDTDIIEVDLVVHGAGRIPELDRIDLKAAGVEHGVRGVSVHPHLQSTSNARVWAAGDSAATEGMPLTPVAVFEGKVAASNMLEDQTNVPDYTGVPTVVYTIPELARVGLLEREARDAGIDVEVLLHDTGGWYSNYRVGEHTATTKILVDRTTDTIVGAHMLGPGYGELINICAMAIKLGLTTSQLRSTPSSYPSVGSDLAAMLS